MGNNCQLIFITTFRELLYAFYLHLYLNYVRGKAFLSKKGFNFLFLIRLFTKVRVTDVLLNHTNRLFSTFNIRDAQSVQKV